MRTALDNSQRLIAEAFAVVCRLMAVVSVLGLGCAMVSAQNSRSAYLRMTFSAEGHAIRTTACLHVTERVYPQSAWWEAVSGDASAPERALKAVIAAIKRKDRPALLKLSHPTQGRDPKRFDGQAAAYFQQFEVLELVAMPRAYEFDGLVVFFAKIRLKDQTAFAPFVFAYEDDGSFGFLPYRTEKLTYQLVENSFDSNVEGGCNGHSCVLSSRGHQARHASDLAWIFRGHLEPALATKSIVSDWCSSRPNLESSPTSSCGPNQRSRT